jgi:AraC-like DNA-binding protein
MQFSKEKIIETINKTLKTVDLKRLYFAEMYTDVNPSAKGYSKAQPRLTIVIDGTLQVMLGSAGDYRKHEFVKGDVLIMKPHCLTGAFWEKCHETLALVFFPSYIRLVHAVHDTPNVPLYEPTHYYHLNDSLRSCTTFTMNAVCSLHESDENKTGTAILKSALELLLTDVKNSTVLKLGKAYALWNKITDYIAAISPEEQTRKGIAEHFGITESYVSRLFSIYGGKTFKEYLRLERLNKAMKLLGKTNMTIDEIAWSCGFQSTSYFIRTFKKAYQISPGMQRRLKQ